MAAAALPAVTASLARGVSGSELPDIVSRSSLRTRRASAPGTVWASAYRDPLTCPNRGTSTVPARHSRAHEDRTLAADAEHGSIPGTRGRVRPVTLLGDPVLHTPCEDVTDFGPELAQLVEDMFATMYAAQGVGLAANQVGVASRVFVYDCPDDEDVAIWDTRRTPVSSRRTEWCCAGRRAVSRCPAWKRGRSGTTTPLSRVSGWTERCRCGARGGSPGVCSTSTTIWRVVCTWTG